MTWAAMLPERSWERPVRPWEAMALDDGPHGVAHGDGAGGLDAFFAEAGGLFFEVLHKFGLDALDGLPVGLAFAVDVHLLEGSFLEGACGMDQAFGIDGRRGGDGGGVLGDGEEGDAQGRAGGELLDLRQNSLGERGPIERGEDMAIHRVFRA